MLACQGRDAASVQPQAVPAAAQATAQPAPGPAPAQPPARSKLAGRSFRIKAGGDAPDPLAVKAALESGKTVPNGVEELGAAHEKRRQADAAMKQKVAKSVTQMYGMIAGKPMDVLEVTKASGLWRVTFQTRGVKEAPSTVHVSGDGKLAFEGGFELKRRYGKLQGDHNFAKCLHLRGVRVIGDGRDKATAAQIKEIGSFAGKVLVDCSRVKDGCARLMKKLNIKKLPVIEHGEDRFTGPRPRAFLETLSGCK